MLCLKVVLFGKNRAEKLVRLLGTRSVNPIYAVMQELGHEAVNRPRQELERSYSTVLVSCSFFSNRGSGLVATCICWNGEENRDDENQNWYRVVLLRSGRVLQNPVGPLGLVRAALLIVTLLPNICVGSFCR